MPNTIKILHLEDEPSDALLISHSLRRRKLDTQIMVADSKEKFILALDNFNPDIILADHSLPSFNSFEALELLAKSQKSVPVILVTATMTDEFAVDIIKKGAKDYILKDRLERLPSAIESVLKIHRLELERQDFVEQLERSERKFRRLVENSANSVAILSSKGVPLYVSPSVKNVLGYSENESLLFDFSENIHRDYREFYSQKWEECKENPEKPFFGIVVKVKHKSGDWIWVESTFTNLLHDPDVQGIVVDFRDVTERKLAEKALLESEEKYRAFFENSRDGILLTATDGRILAANAAACEMFQRTEREICEVGREGLIDINDPRVEMALKERQKTGKILLEINMLRKDGSIFPAALSSSVFRSAKNEELTSMIIRDSSEVKKVEEELRTSEKKYKQLFENNPLPNLIYDIDNFEILDVNNSAVDYYGYSREEFQKLTVLDILPTKDQLWLRENISQLSDREGRLSHTNVRNIKKNGDQTKVEIFGYNLPSQERNCRLIICLDVTEKEAALARLEEKKNKLLAAQKIARLGYWEYDLNSQKMFWTDQVYEIIGQNKKDFPASFETFESIVHPEDLENFHLHKLMALKGKEEIDLEHRIVLHDGNIKWVHERGKLVKSEKGTILEGSVQDITEHKSFLEKLMRSEAQQRGILQSQTNYLTRLNLEGYYTYSNEKFSKDFAWVFESGKVVGEYGLTTIHEHHQKTAEEVFYKCIAHPNTIHQIELDKLQKDGSVKSTLWDFICLTDSNNEPFEVQAVGIDITERVKAEKALKESNQRHELVSKATSDAIYDWDCQSGKIFWSEGYSKIFGYSPGSFDPDFDAWSSNIHPEDQFILEDLSSAIEGKSETWEAEYRYKRADGEYASVTEKGIILRDNTGKALRMVGAIHDVTHRRQAMQKLMRSEARHRGLVQSQTNYVIRVDMEGNYTYSNKKFEDDFGWIYPDNKVVGKNTMQSIKEYHHQKVIDVSQKCLENPDQVFQVEIDKPSKDGKVKTTLWDFIYLKASSDDPDEIQCVGIDITARVRAEKEMRFQANLLDKIGQAVIATDSEGVINYWNKAATTIFGWKPEEIKGKNILGQTPSVASAIMAHEIKEVLQKGENWSGELVVQRKDGSEFPALITGSPVYDEKQRFKGYIAVSSDITERKNADLRLRELNKNLRNYTRELVTANKGLEQFSFIVSHNLRSPVANILGLAELLEQENYPDEIKEKFFSELLSNVKRLDNVVTDLNAILQVKVEMDAQKEMVDLQDLVESIQLSINDIITEEQVQIFTDFSEVSHLHTVHSYLHSIFYNLIINSIKYRRPGVQAIIDIETIKTTNAVRVIFRDNGLGIDLEKKGGQIFGLYKRFHHHVEGKGMGLFMVKTQVELLGGKISLESEVNKGTQFTIKFPIAKSSRENEETEAVHSC